MSLAPAVEKDGFASVGNAFNAYASGHNCHRRATRSELEELFRPASGTTSATKDPPAHWYESQLIHYGLPPSKTKSVAKLRLMSAFHEGNMVVPQHLQKLETELRKKWNTNDRQAKKGRQGLDSVGAVVAKEKPTLGKEAKRPGGATKKSDLTAQTKQAGKKRKLDGSDLDGTVTPSSAKKAAVAKPKLTKTPTRNSSVKAISAGVKKSSAKADTASTGSVKSLSKARNSSACKKQAKGTTEDVTIGKKQSKQKIENASEGKKPLTSNPAHKLRPDEIGFAGRSQPRKPSARFDARTSTPLPISTATLPRPRQTARRSRPFNPGFRFDSRPPLIEAQGDEDSNFITWQAHWERSTSSSHPSAEADQDGYEDEDGDRSELESEDEDLSLDDFKRDSDDDESMYDSEQHHVAVDCSDLTNGVYNVDTSVDNGWSLYEDHQSTITLIEHCGEIWGAYDFGMFEGVIRVTQRRNSTIDFSWRGTENSENVISYDDGRQHGEITLDRGKAIWGVFHGVYGEVSFQGRHDGQQVIEKRETHQILKHRWASYNEDAYESARVSRWR